MMTESAIVNRWLAQGEQRGVLKARREDVLRVLDRRFPGEVTAQLRAVIQKEESETLLQDWLDKAYSVNNYADFIKQMR